MSNPLVTVIIPVYNTEKYLGECLESVVRQSYLNLDIIIINDGSKDKSLEIINSYQLIDKRIRVVNQNNHGLSYARNVGIANAIGKYICFLDSDDFLALDAINLLVDIAQSNESDFIFFDYFRVDSFEGQYKMTLCKRSHSKIDKSQRDSKDWLEYLVDIDCYYPFVCTLFVKTAYLNHYRFSFVEGMLYEDHAFTYNIFINAKTTSYLSKPLYFYRNNPNSITKGKHSVKDFISRSELVRFYCQQPLKDNVDISKLVVKTIPWVFVEYHSLDNENKKTMINRLFEDKQMIKSQKYYRSFKIFVVVNYFSIYDIIVKVRKLIIK